MRITDTNDNPPFFVQDQYKVLLIFKNLNFTINNLIVNLIVKKQQLLYGLNFCIKLNINKI